MLAWDQVRRLYVRHVAPSFCAVGFRRPGRTMRRYRADFVDVIDFHCGKYNDRANISFGCGLRMFVKQNPRPWHCTFDHWPHDETLTRLLEFQENEDAQVEAFSQLQPLLLGRAERWFALLPDLLTAREAAARNTAVDDASVATFRVPSPAHGEALRLLDAAFSAAPPSAKRTGARSR